MKKHIPLILLLLLLTITGCTKKQAEIPPRLIAHAGGQLGGMDYTNCKEALDNSYKEGLRYFEIDFSYTTDGQLICVHSYDGFMEKFFDAPRAPCSYEQWQGFTMVNGWTKLELASVMDWLSAHKDAYLITDVKGDNIEVQRRIAEGWPQLQNRVIPQVYSIMEYFPVKELGFENIILTLYREPMTDAEIVAFAAENPLFGVTMYYERAGNKELVEALAPTRTFAHTVNDEALAAELIQGGFYGIYTDTIYDLHIEE